MPVRPQHPASLRHVVGDVVAPVGIQRLPQRLHGSRENGFRLLGAADGLADPVDQRLAPQGFRQLQLCLLAGGDVHRDAVKADRDAAADRTAPAQSALIQRVPPSGAECAVLHVILRPLLNRPVHCLPRSFPVIRVQQRIKQCEIHVGVRRQEEVLFAGLIPDDLVKRPLAVERAEARRADRELQILKERWFIFNVHGRMCHSLSAGKKTVSGPKTPVIVLVYAKFRYLCPELA